MICCNIFVVTHLQIISYPLFVLTLYSVPFKWVLLSTNVSCECLSLQFQSLIFQWLLQMLSANQMFSHFDCVLQKNIMTLNYENKNLLNDSEDSNCDLVSYKYISNYNGNSSWSYWSRRLINVRFFHKILWLVYFHF